MQIPFFIKIAIIVLTGLSLFWLPWPVTLAGIFLSGLAFPPAAAAFGILADILYYPGSGMPTATITGAALTLAAVLVRYIVKTRIM
jgi:hypothetical protein